jgi:hypothetical protein
VIGNEHEGIMEIVFWQYNGLQTAFLKNSTYRIFRSPNYGCNLDKNITIYDKSGIITM